MGFCSSGIDKRITTTKFTIEVSDNQPLIKLANKIEWNRLTDIALVDLKQTTPKWRHRPLSFWREITLPSNCHLTVMPAKAGIQEIVNENSWML